MAKGNSYFSKLLPAYPHSYEWGVRRLLYQPNLPDFSFLGARGFNLADDFSGMLQFVSYLALR